MRTLDKNFSEALLQVSSNCDREKYFNEHRDRYKMILQRVKKYVPEGKVLDVGTGPGHMAMALSQLGYDVSATNYDLDEDWERLSDQNLHFRYQIHKYNIDLKQCDIQNEPLPFRDNQFDVVIFSEVLEHLWMFPAQVLAEIFRVLKPGGYMILTTPNATSLRNRVWWLMGKTTFTHLETMISLPIFIRHNREYTLKEVNEITTRCGFNLLESGYQDWYQWTSKKPHEHAYEDKFKINSKREIAKLILWPVALLIPSIRGGILTVGQKPLI